MTSNHDSGAKMLDVHPAHHAANTWRDQYRMGSDMRNLHDGFPDFTPNPTTEELIEIVHEPHTDQYLRMGAGLPVPGSLLPGSEPPPGR